MEEPRNKRTDFDRWDIDRVRYRMDAPPAPRRELRSVADILPDVVAGLAQPESEEIMVLRKAWPELCGAQISQHSEPGFLKDHVLHIRVDHPGFLPELERIKRVIEGKLKARYRAMGIRRILFVPAYK